VAGQASAGKLVNRHAATPQRTGGGGPGEAELWEVASLEEAGEEESGPGAALREGAAKPY
jgi:hypothetical protein